MFLQSNQETVERLLRAYIEGVAMIVYEKDRAVKALAKDLRLTDPVFLDESYTVVRNYTERTSRSDARAIPHCWNSSRLKESTRDTLAAKVIDGSIVDQFIEDKFIDKLSAKEPRECVDRISAHHLPISFLA